MTSAIMTALLPTLTNRSAWSPPMPCHMETDAGLYTTSVNSIGR